MRRACPVEPSARPSRRSATPASRFRPASHRRRDASDPAPPRQGVGHLHPPDPVNDLGDRVLDPAARGDLAGVPEQILGKAGKQQGKEAALSPREDAEQIGGDGPEQIDRLKTRDQIASSTYRSPPHPAFAWACASNLCAAGLWRGGSNVTPSFEAAVRATTVHGRPAASNFRAMKSPSSRLWLDISS